MEERKVAKTFLVISLIIIALLFGLVSYLLIDRVTKLTSNASKESENSEAEKKEGEGEAKTYTIRWINDDGTVLETDTNVGEGVVPTYDQATNPTKEGEGLISYTFKGWNKEVVAANGDATYVATYTTNYGKATVTFDMGGVGDAIDQQQIDYGGYVTKPANPTAAGHVFNGWYKDSSFTNAWNFATDKVTSNVTIYVKWQVLYYSVKFYAEEYDAEVYTTQSVAYGQKITRPVDPVQSNANFDYWFTYTDDWDEVIWDFENDIVTEDVTLYGRWIWSL